VATLILRVKNPQGLECEQLSNLAGLLRYSCEIKGNQRACDDLRRIEAIAKNKGCAI